jgi:hypothetical protein
MVRKTMHPNLQMSYALLCIVLEYLTQISTARPRQAKVPTRKSDFDRLPPVSAGPSRFNPMTYLFLNGILLIHGDPGNSRKILTVCIQLQVICLV